MKVIAFLFKNVDKVKMTFLLLLALTTGLINTLILYCINGFIDESILKNETNGILYSAGIVLFVILNVIFFWGLIKVSEELMANIKINIFNTILTKSGFKKINEYKDYIYTTVSSDVNIISESLLQLVHIIISVATVLSCFIYMGWLSWKLLLLTLGMLVISVLTFILLFKIAYPQLEKSRNLQDEIISLLNQILNGFKELKIFSKKNKVIESIVKAKINEVYKHKVNALTKLSIMAILASTISFCFLGILLIVFPIYFPKEKSVIVSFAIVFLFLLKPLESIISLLSFISQANIATKKILNISNLLEEEQPKFDSNKVSFFEDILINDLSYTHYDTHHKFNVGPIDFDLKRNEIVFIYGGNGSGKTTFINSLIGIYNPDIKERYLNQTKISSEQWNTFITNNVAPIFSDFYLFDKLYEIDTIDKVKVNKYFELFEITDKVWIDNDRFSTIDLSTGQRKRLALISALLENRPILILDEWAADQDPYFRNKFYTQILPWLVNEEDRTIVAITHDDKYFNVADRLFKMEYGTLIEHKKLDTKVIF
ncbi:cyclic peptide export ABC transporter [Aquimarina sp. 2201CG1-2-11]|uniref:cyclic peptide export ABC transporter n=1 Tax=Aquimarina discodermiae TaxID=3231043 RepID=UPI003462A110